MIHIGTDSDTESPVKYFTVIVTVQPVAVATTIGSDVTFSMDYAAVIPAEITLVWQCCLNFNALTPATNKWVDLVETPGVYENTTTKILSVRGVDNFLCAFGARFRCKILFAGSVPTFTDPAAVTAAGALTWKNGDAAINGGVYLGTTFAWNNSGSGAFLNPHAPLPVDPVAFPGPYTFLWARVSGPAWTCANPTAQAPSILSSGPDGFNLGVWKCTVSNGILTTVSDPIYLVAYFFPVAQQPIGGATSVGPSIAKNGAAFTTFASTDTPFTAPWVVMATQRQRAPATPTFSIVDPTAKFTTFALSSDYPGGTALFGFVAYLSNSGVPGFFYITIGNSGWTGQN